MQRLSRVLIFSAFFMLWACIALAQTFSQQGDKLLGNGGTNAQQFGYAAAMSANGSTAVVGAYNDDGGHGAAYIYRRLGSVWIQQAKLIGTANYTNNVPFEGYAVAISNDGNTVIIGGPQESGFINGAYGLNGAVWIFTYNGTYWVEQSKITGAYSQMLGRTVSLSADGKTALIGSSFNDVGATEVWVNAGGIWTKQASLLGTNPSDAIRPGFSVSLSADGNTALIGAPTDNGNTGAAWVFTRNGTVWTQQTGTLTSTGTSNFGWSVSISADGNTALMGAYLEGNQHQGAVYVYVRNNGVWTQQGAKISASDAGNLSTFGSAVSLSADGNTALIGGRGDNNSVGAIWVFNRTGNVWTQNGSKLVGTGHVNYGFQGSAVSLSADGNTALVGGYMDNNLQGAAWVFTHAVVPIITVTPVSGTITTCEHTASVNPKIQQFTVTGSSLTNDITVSAPPGFDVSLDPNDNYNTTLVIPQNPNLPGSALATVYVRASSLATAGPISGNVVLGSTGATAQQVAVSGMVYAIATADQKTLPAYTGGQTVPAITFTGTADSYNWTSDNTAIGLSASSGTNSIPSFTALNNGTTNITAHIKVTPISNNGCPGADMLFDIVVKPLGPVIIVSPITGNAMTTCQGVPSTDYQQFTVSADNLTGSNKIIIKPTNSSVQISTIPSPLGFIDEIPLSPQTGTVTPVTIYVRISAAAPAGTLSSAVQINYTFPDGSTPFARMRTPSGNVRAQGTVNPVATPQNCIANVRKKITFSGTATQYKWTNDNPGIGLGYEGFGDIDFLPVNNGTTTIIAHLKVIPLNTFGCEGTPFSFTIIVPAVQANVIQVTGSLPFLGTNYGTASTAGSFHVSGDNMQSGITVTPPLGYEVSTDDITFGKTLTVGSAGNIPSTEVYIRLAKTTPAGTYPGDVVLSSPGAADAKITVNSTDAVSRVPLIIIADNKTKITGTANPPLTASYLGFVNNENSSVLTAKPQLSTTATVDSPPGMYVIKASGAAAANYAISYTDGTMTVKQQPLTIVVNNTFTPNGDGINDTWIIKNIDGFPNSVVQIFNRYGAPVFYSVSYAVPWDGTLKGTALPAGTYYYVIDLKNGDKPATGWVAIIR